MAAQTTALTEYSTVGNTRTSMLSTHLSTKAALCIEKRSNISSKSRVIEKKFTLVHGVDDSNGEVLAEKLAFEAVVRVPMYMDDATVMTAAKAAFLDIVNGDEFAASITNAGWLKT